MATTHFHFPPLSSATEEGILAQGGDLSPERLRYAYEQGIFPMYSDGQPILWWSPDPRCVLFPADLKISHSMRQVLRNSGYRYRFNTHFQEVITRCGHIGRKDSEGTWINSDIISAYTKLYVQGMAFSAETWFNGKLVGGCYGVWLGNVFFGESMFSEMSNASKFAFIHLLKQEGKNLALVDCQMESSHLKSLGATLIDRNDFVELLKLHTKSSDSE